MNQDLDPSFAPTPQPRRGSVLPLILIIGERFSSFMPQGSAARRIQLS